MRVHLVGKFVKNDVDKCGKVVDKCKSLKFQGFWPFINKRLYELSTTYL
jgi:hypothetical protein